MASPRNSRSRSRSAAQSPARRSSSRNNPRKGSASRSRSAPRSRSCSASNTRSPADAKRVSSSKSEFKPVTLRVENLTRNVNADHLREIFGKFGLVLRVDLAVPRGKASAVVAFASQLDADIAKDHMHDGWLDGNKLRVLPDAPKPEPSSRRRVSLSPRGRSRRDGRGRSPSPASRNRQRSPLRGGRARRGASPFRGSTMAAVTADYKLFTPLKLGDDLELKNRIVFGPLTRGRSNADRVPSENNEIYYEQRAGAGLIISEATGISEQGYGWHHAAACYTDAHVEGWKRVTERVHKKGGKIFMQLWHMGRQSHSSFNSKGEIVSASALRLESGHTRNADYIASDYETPRALETDEIPGVVESYRHSAELALKAGFDGVEIHGANGYLIDQFLQSCTNKRTDKYGGSFENRARLLIEVVEAIKTVVPSHRIGVRLAPNGGFAGMGSEDNYEMFKYTMERLSTYGLGYLAILDGFGFGYTDKCRLTTAFDAKTAFKGIVMANNNYTRDRAEGAIRTGAADLVGFGRLYITNPDLAERFQNDWPIAPEAGHEVYYNTSLGGKGYIDFPSYQPKGELSN
ncbi:hypothetical protein PF005_g13256 [Phytophthora fragariae]|uniref:RRM domain-containing protein n=1 Tax=Phytophthora fragariae TaxID=53985 RepID=A0A6A3RY39_9STRA|nr:hypothetical protein PF009_g14281 [Phytophthora fragariae]KAE9106026.1 hypothetical protein PF007_g13552 [Phytophthora fragariae]KAE9205810.1 hypothetical protein PF005_g13256 [Phytophthora fragariae]KAE9306227.1 hypothetical protein PF001_g12224 [Phytophthora fragariae]